jgi:predicted ATP-grasp superfamily ATP-dependent carboligase
MGIAELMIVLAFGSTKMAFPWFLWLLAAVEVVDRIIAEREDTRTKARREILDEVIRFDVYHDQLLKEVDKLEKKKEKMEEADKSR